MEPLQAGEHATVTLHTKTKSFTVRVPASDVAACIRISLWRGILALVAIALAVSDIPRTGLTISPRTYREQVGPGVAMCWGPYEYAVAHLSVADSDSPLSQPAVSVNASCDGEPIESLEVWSYKYDSLSIAPRALAEKLDVASYPPCILYRAQCASTVLTPAVVFAMLDDLVTSIQARYFPTAQSELQPLHFFTKSNWVDRIHHMLFRYLTKNPETRLHSAYHISSRSNTIPKTRRPDPRSLCGQSFPIESRPIFCDDPTEWNCDHPTEPTGKRDIPIWDHITIRFDDLQRQHPSLQLDLTMTVSTIIEQTHSDSRVVPSASYATEAIEMTTWIRGRRCDNWNRCRTVFIDEYRYERVKIESDEDQWTMYVSVLRGASQLYMWVRVVLLFWGCYAARLGEVKRHTPSPSWRSIVSDVLWTVLKISGHTIVYGSWLPVVGYALAYYFDSSLVHMIGEYAWSSVNGLYDFKPIDYIVTASIQMRNLWMIMLIWKAGFRFLDWLTRGRCTHASQIQQRHGILAFRGAWAGLISWSSTFCLMRALRFRDTDVVGFTELPRHIPILAVRAMATARNYVDYGIRLDLKCNLAACLVVVAFGGIAQIVVRVVTGQRTSLFACRSYYVPLSAGSLWPWRVLDLYWCVNCYPLKASRRVHVHAVVPTGPVDPQYSARVSSAFLPGTGVYGDKPCSVCGFRLSPIHWRHTQGCHVHEKVLDVSRRSKQLWSMVRLTNLAAMTDPIVFVRLRVVGRPLYVYRVHNEDDTDAPSHLVLLPMPPLHETTAESGKQRIRRTRRRANWPAGEMGAAAAAALECVGTVDSRDVPWHVLVNCG